MPSSIVAKFFSEPKEQPFRPTKGKEPISVFVLHHFADCVGAVEVLPLVDEGNR